MKVMEKEFEQRLNSSLCHFFTKAREGKPKRSALQMLLATTLLSCVVSLAGESQVGGCTSLITWLCPVRKCNIHNPKVTLPCQTSGWKGQNWNKVFCIETNDELWWAWWPNFWFHSRVEFLDQVRECRFPEDTSLWINQLFKFVKIPLECLEIL
jgi:hypothetical protein